MGTSHQAAFNLTVTNTAPAISILDQSVVTGQPLVIELPLRDADGHFISYSVEVLGDPLAALDAEHGFWSNGNSYDNYLGQNEHWIRNQNYRCEGSIQDGVFLSIP